MNRFEEEEEEHKERSERPVLLNFWLRFTAPLPKSQRVAFLAIFSLAQQRTNFFLFFNRKEKSKGEAQNVEVDNKKDKGE